MEDYMKVAIIGTGYVGLPTGVGLAELGNNIICIDKNEDKIKKLQNGELTLYEDGLEELFKKNISEGRLNFTTSMSDGIRGADLVIIAVGTPPHPVTKEADLQYIYAAAAELAPYLSGYTVVATKSTVPVGTGDEVENIIRQTNPTADFDVVSLPEFLREGFAIHDFFNPDRIVVGTDSDKAKEVMSALYAPFEGKTTILFTRRRSSEAIKYASNAFLAVKIHYINEMANFCEKADADIREVAMGMGLDTRIGGRFLNPGPGYGGSCFPKDTMAMAYMAKKVGVDMNLINMTIEKNAQRKIEMAHRILDCISAIPNPKIAVLGLAFKNGTDDCRQSPAIEIIQELLKYNLNITAFDPKAMETSKEILGEQIQYAADMYSAVQGANVIAILTEWSVFKELNLQKVSELVADKNIVDCRNLLDKEEAEKFGFTYQGIGTL